MHLSALKLGIPAEICVHRTWVEEGVVCQPNEKNPRDENQSPLMRSEFQEEES